MVETRPNPLTPGLLAGFGAAVLLAAVVPHLVSDFTAFQFTQAMVYAIALLGLNILTGYNGQFSIGHSAFYAVGAYTAAILLYHFEWSHYATLPVAALVAFAVGFLFGLPALRLEGLYLALATFAFAVATPQLLKFDAFEHWTGGVQGLYVPKPEPLIDGLSADQSLYYVTLAVLAFLMAAAWCLLHSRSGRAIMAIRDNPIAASTMGIDTALYKTTTFGISAMYTGVAGALSVFITEFVAPDAFNFFLAVNILVGSVVGGIVSIPGVIFGGLFLVFVPNFAQDISRAWPFVPPPWAIFGVFLILAVYFVPFGVWGAVERVFAWWKRKSAAGK